MPALCWSACDVTRKRVTSPLAVWEAAVALNRILGLSIRAAGQALDECLKLTGIVVEPVPPEAALLALQAFHRFGKGRHPAKLNFGDCFAYACAQYYGVPLLCKGADFPQTDIQLA